MNINSDKTVWINVESDRYYIIPNDKQLPEGTFELKTVDRKERSANEVDVSGYEVTEGEAHKWMEQQVQEQMNRAKEAVKNAFEERKKEFQPQIVQPVLEPTTSSGKVSVSPALTMVTSENGNGTFDSFDSFVESKESKPTPERRDVDLDDHIKEAVSILNKAVSDIQLSAARAVADLQELKEKAMSKVPA